MVPRLSFLDMDGTGLDRSSRCALLAAAGGYVQVLLDGRPLNGLEAGLIDGT
jgi:hypothetical protein